MRKTLNRVLVIGVVLALLVSSFAIPVSATEPASKWTKSAGATINSESTEIVAVGADLLVVDTVTVTMANAHDWIQNNQKLTALIGKNGEDGTGYINVLPENLTSTCLDYVFVKLMGKADDTSTGRIDGATGLSWYFKSSTSSEYGSHAGPSNMTFVKYGWRTTVSAELTRNGFRLAFTENENGYVQPRGIGSGVDAAYKTYEGTAGIASATKLSAVEGAGETTGQDGVYARFESNGGAGYNMKYTISVAYPALTVKTTDSKWTLGGGAVSLGEYTETKVVGDTKMVYDTIKVDLKTADGFVQNNQLLTELIGAAGADGKGYFNITAEDFSTDYVFVQLVGKKDATGIDPVQDTKAMTWYFREGGAANNAIAYLRPSTNGVIYGLRADFKDAGYRFAFTQNTDGKVQIRGIGEGVHTSFDEYTDTAEYLTSKLKLSEIVGDSADKTGEDGVYARVQSFGDPGCNFVYLVTVAYPEPVVDDGDLDDKDDDQDDNEDQEENKPTGDASLVVLATLLVAGCAVVVASKKRAYNK